MPVFSLSGPYGIGTFGRTAYEFVDFLREAGQTYWQILPLNPVNEWGSPYQSFSASAGNPYFIDPDTLVTDGLLTAEECAAASAESDPGRVDYGKLAQRRLPLLRQAYARFDPADPVFAAYCRRESDWLEDYALFMALKDANGGVDWRRWPDELKTRRPAALADAAATLRDECGFYRFIQYEFDRQWSALKRYANDRGIRIIGDMPIYVADDSADVWAHTDLFDLDGALDPRVVAGCPPDAFSEDGQVWGMPVYRWDVMAAEPTPFSWWRRRMRRALAIYDTVRIDHFRGLESYFCIPAGDATARNGVWRPGPGMALFDALRQEYGDAELPIIAEDLGFLTPAVRQLLTDSGCPGMAVLQFAFGGAEGDYLPHRHTRHSVVYTGTHDNDTVAGWVHSGAPGEVERARRYLHVDEREGFHWAMIRAALASVADTAILPMADFMGLGSEARINTPGTVEGNWQWRIAPGCVNSWLAGIIRENVALYCRLPARG